MLDDSNMIGLPPGGNSHVQRMSRMSMPMRSRFARRDVVWSESYSEQLQVMQESWIAPRSPASFKHRMYKSSGSLIVRGPSQGTAPASILLSSPRLPPQCAAFFSSCSALLMNSLLSVSPDLSSPPPWASTHCMNCSSSLLCALTGGPFCFDLSPPLTAK